MLGKWKLGNRYALSWQTLPIPPPHLSSGFSFVILLSFPAKGSSPAVPISSLIKVPVLKTWSQAAYNSACLMHRKVYFAIEMTSLGKWVLGTLHSQNHKVFKWIGLPDAFLRMFGPFPFHSLSLYRKIRWRSVFWKRLLLSNFPIQCYYFQQGNTGLCMHLLGIQLHKQNQTKRKQANNPSSAN